MKEAFLIAVSAGLAGLNSHFGLCPDWVAISVAIILFYIYIKIYIPEYSHYRFGILVGCWWLPVIVVSIVAYAYGMSHELAWCKDLAIMMLISGVDMYIGLLTYHGYY